MPKVSKTKYYDLNSAFTDGGLGHIYSSDAINSLVAWIDMAPTPKDKGPFSLSVSYISSPSTSEKQVGTYGKVYNAVAITEATGQYATIADPGGLLTFTNAADGGTGSIAEDRPYSVGFWISLVNITNGQYLWSKVGDGSSTVWFYVRNAASGGHLQHSHYDSAGNYIRVVSSGGEGNFLVYPYGGYLVVTYDGSGTGAGMKMYINGDEIAVTPGASGTYAGISPDYSEDFEIGRRNPGDMGGEVAEFAIWDHVLTLNEIRAIFNATLGPSNRIQSGFLNNPPRSILRMLDSTLQSYPTISRTGDPDFSGREHIREFDDTWTIAFTTGSLPLYMGSGSKGVTGCGPTQLIQYPSLMPIGNPFMSMSAAHTLHGGGRGDSFVMSPNLTSSITISRELNTTAGEELFGNSQVYADIRNGITGSTRRFPGAQLSPFNDSRVHIGSSSFYLTGTSLDLMPGFENPLSDKVQLVFNLDTPSDNDSKTWIFFATGVGGPDSTNSYYKRKSLAGLTGSGMAYYSPSEKHWEMLVPENVDVYSLLGSTRAKACLAFQPDPGYAYNTIDADAIENVGMPIHDFGFPAAAQYNATGSQYFDMSNYISTPFLLEKMRIEITGSFGLAAANINEGPFLKQFFVLNQFNPGKTTLLGPPLTGTYSITQYIAGYGTSSLVQQRGHREMIGWANFAFVRNDQASALTYTGFWDAVKEVTSADTNINYGVTCSMTAEVVPKIASISKGIGQGCIRNPGMPLDSPTPPAVGSSRFSLLTNPYGSRDLRGTSSGRSFIRSVVGSHTKKVIELDADYSPYNNADIQISASHESPYLLFPKDRLIFGWHNHPKTMDGHGTSSGNNEEMKLSEYIADKLSTIKVTFFGSMIKEAKEYPSMLNTPLTSDAIHEDVQGEMILDQYQVDPSYVYVGTYMDNIYTGDLLKGTRVVAGRSSNGTQGTTGSLLRGVKIPTRNERYYDSLLPGLSSYFAKRTVSGSIFSQQGISTAPNAAGFPRLPVGVNGYYFSGAISHRGTTEFDDSWRADAALPWPYDGNPERVFNESAVLVTSGSSDDSEITFVAGYNNVKKALYMYGISESYLALSTTQAGLTSVGTLRLQDEKFPAGATGLKYGIVSINPLFSEAVFRYDRYGQLRDMLEQRHDTRFYDMSEDASTTVMASPINIIFVDRDGGNPVNPDQTASQNLSVYATSSIPYIDGKTVDRVDNPDDFTSVVVSELMSSDLGSFGPI